MLRFDFTALSLQDCFVFFGIQMSMSALPTADDGRSQVVGSKVNTLPRGATISDNYTVMQVCVSEE